MSYVTRTLVLLLVGLFMMTASASADDRLTISGSMKNHVFGVSNFSGFDANFTSLTLDGDPQAGDQDNFVLGSSRIWVNFTVEAFENTRFYFSTLTDQFWGARAEGDLYGDGQVWYPDSYNNNAIRFKTAFVEVPIPGTAATLRTGGIDSTAQRLKGCTFYCLDTPGFSLTAPLSDTVNTFTWYAQWSDEWDNAGGLGADGESWAAGTRVEFAPMEGLDVDLIYVYQRLDCPNGGGLSCIYTALQLRRGEAGAGSPMVALDNRNWAGIDMRYQYGDFTLAPTVIFHFGNTELVGGGESDIASFLLDIEGTYQIGPLTLRGRVAFSPGDEASDALGDGSTLNSWQAMLWYSQASLSWFMLWGPRQLEIYPSIFDYSSARSLDTRMSFDQFGAMVVAARADYALNERTTLSGMVGFLNSAEDVGRPARFGPISDTDNPDYNYTGDGTHIATEVNAELAYVLNPSTTVRFWAAYSMNGDALDLTTESGAVAESEDTAGAGASLTYSF